MANLLNLDKAKSRKVKKNDTKEKLNQVLQDAPEIRREEIEEQELVGSGQYGDVYKGKCRGLDVAIKILKNKFGTDEQLNSFKREVSIMSRIRFPNVCLLLGACTDPDYFCIVQEYLPGGDLAHLLEKGKLPPSFYARMRLGSQIARGLIWIHSNGVLHRDLKLENLLLDKYGEVKVCDFGLADTTGGMKFIWDEKGRKGSPLYMAPEVLLKKGLNTKVDVYSFGIILWELLAKQRAFQHHLQHNNLDIFTAAICKDMERPPIPPPVADKEKENWKNEYVVNLLHRCWGDRARDRPDFQEIYDELNVLIIDGYIKDDWGRTFWLINFPDEDYVKFDDFYKIIESNKEVELEDGSRFCKGLALPPVKDGDPDKRKEYFKLLMAQISGIAVANLTTVTCEDFGKLLAWFGPGIEEKNQTTFLDRVVDICRHPWFWGAPQNPESIILEQNQFLVRLASIPGRFTLHTPRMKYYIFYYAGKGYQLDSKKDSPPVLPTLDDVITHYGHTLLAKLSHKPGSAFHMITNPTPYNC
eukprot:TRINITY_DN272_c0_g1_i2.p1 TRINITY_DN272_c0_g1~~TRINITY_DN272_c0_g1_i2.p1  ORF type:complete len:528 (-),score=105.30 TRINITY_DN272_c0_g1_i2:120-1703(-)